MLVFAIYLCPVFWMDSAFSSACSQVIFTGMSVLILQLNISSAEVGKLYPVGVSWYVSKAALTSLCIV